MIVYHMVSRVRWEAQSPKRAYSADTLATEGFIHCTAEPEVLLRVANRFYQQIDGEWLVLALDTEKLTEELRWEVADGHRFPHVYGPINREAVMAVLSFPRKPDGEFTAPPSFAG
jgi:uncharacterized protein (DUF952 family)